MPLTWPDKDPDDIIDYGYNVVGFDADDTVAASEAVVLAGSITIVSHAAVTGGTSTKTRISGGVDGETAQVRIRNTMTSGQRVDQTMNLRIAQR